MGKYTYWENTQGGHNKFWAGQIIEEEREVQTPGGTVKKPVYSLVRKWGKIGTAGQSMSQVFNTREEAQQMLHRLIWDKENKGYKGVF
jgi:predicted DNA-binding WGR domain protein